VRSYTEPATGGPTIDETPRNKTRRPKALKAFYKSNLLLFFANKIFFKYFNVCLFGKMTVGESTIRQNDIIGKMTLGKPSLVKRLLYKRLLGELTWYQIFALFFKANLKFGKISRARKQLLESKLI